MEPQMPSPAPVIPIRQDNLSMIDSHEERIQRLEGGMQTIASQNATIMAQQEAMGARLDDGFANVVTQMQATIAPLAAQFAGHARDDAQALEKIDGHYAELAPAVQQAQETADAAKTVTDGVVALQKKSADRRAAWKKALITVVIAAAGVVVKMLIDGIVHFFSKDVHISIPKG